MVKKLIALTALIIVIFVGRYIILGGAGSVHLASAQPLSGLVSQALYSNKTKSPVAGKDFKLENITYFQNGDYAVANITALTKKTNSGYVVFQKIAANYQIILGPSTSLDASSLSLLPSGVSSYLNNQTSGGGGNGE